MKQPIFETRQKAEELLRAALSIWRQSDQVDFLEGIENDPVMSLLMMALAYQANETNSEIERLKEEVLEDFVHILTPFEMGHAIPATAVVRADLAEEVDEKNVNSDTVFSLAPDFTFLPLLNTRALNCRVNSVVRMDGRRWKVVLNFRHAITDLSLFSFAITNANFRDVTVSVKGQRLPLIKPWDYSELPFSTCFDLQSLPYNEAQMYNASLLPLDLFARQNVRLYCVDRHQANQFIPTETERLELVFEFTGINDDFLFDKTKIALNAIMLVNAQMHEATLTSRLPIARLSGYASAGDTQDLTSRQFLHLIQPLDTQIYGRTRLEVRRVAGDRFNQGSLVKLLNCIINKYHSDFYAFQNLRELSTDKAIYSLEEVLAKLMEAGLQDATHNVPGVYLLLHQKNVMQDKEFSLGVQYLTTAGAAVNPFLTATSVFTSQSEFDNSSIQQICTPVPGSDEVTNEIASDSMLRYYMLTSDRIVTPADIKMFCYKELMTQYGITCKMFRQVRVSRRQQQENTGCGYEIFVHILLSANSFIRRSFVDRIPAVEIMLQKMMEVRSTNIYPIQVKIDVEE